MKSIPRRAVPCRQLRVCSERECGACSRGRWRSPSSSRRRSAPATGPDGPRTPRLPQPRRQARPRGRLPCRRSPAGIGSGRAWSGWPPRSARDGGRERRGSTRRASGSPVSSSPSDSIRRSSGKRASSPSRSRSMRRSGLRRRTWRKLSPRRPLTAAPRSNNSSSVPTGRRWRRGDRGRSICRSSLPATGSPPRRRTTTITPRSAPGGRRGPR